MYASHKDRTTALQRSIEAGNAHELNLVHPTRYRQHNPNLRDGVAGVAEIHALLPHDEVYTHVVRAFEDGDYAFVHVDYHLFGPTVAFDVHRYEGGLSVEHWDNLQPMPPGRNTAGRTMTDGKTQVRDRDQTEANKAVVRRFTERVLVGGEADAVGEYFDGGRLMQHNPHMGDGVAEFLAVRRAWAEQGTPARYDALHMVLGEGNFVLAMSEGAFAGKHAAFFDLYRVDGGRIVEHWDVIEEIPAEADRKNGNGKF